MGEVLGVGMTHFPPLAAQDERMTSAFSRMLNHPSTPEEAKTAAALPAELVAELADDNGLAAAAVHRARLRENLSRVRDRIDEFNPDLVVIWGDDQYENFKESIIPPFCVLAYDEFVHKPWQNFHLGENAWGEDVDTEIKIAGNNKAGRYLTTGLIEAGFDMAYSYRPNEYPGLSHAFTNTVLYLDYDRKGFPYPILPISVNCYGRLVVSAKGLFVDPGNPPSGDQLDPPSPSPQRCFDLGAATARVLQDSPWKVALVASASWSHGFLAACNRYLYPDVATDRRLFDALKNGDDEVWRSYPLDAIEKSGQQEMLNWFCLLGAMAELGKTLEWAELVETHIFNSNKAFVLF
ncbi:DODA-type extradiol aromatic ring-opening family dioxygenase [Jatrophihabitans sp. DSM 45814]